MSEQSAEHNAARLVAHPEPGKVWVQIPHHNDIGSDWIAVDELPASVPPTQPPAAPETDVRLTEAESDLLFEHFASDEGDEVYLGPCMLRDDVERIVAERVRVVEGERDALVDQWDDSGWLAPAEVEALTARAEAAEAAHAALVEAIKKAEPTWPRGMYGCPDDMFSRRDLRALLAGDAR